MGGVLAVLLFTSLNKSTANGPPFSAVCDSGTSGKSARSAVNSLPNTRIFASSHKQGYPCGTVYIFSQFSGLNFGGGGPKLVPMDSVLGINVPHDHLEFPYVSTPSHLDETAIRCLEYS